MGIPPFGAGCKCLCRKKMIKDRQLLHVARPIDITSMDIHVRTLVSHVDYHIRLG